MSALFEEAQSYLDYWQKELKLSNWEFQLHFNGEQKSAGKIDFSTVAYRAVITINPKENSWINKDDNLEFVILHEMLHLVLADVIKEKCESDELYFDVKERVVNKVADALLRVKYEDNNGCYC